MEYPRENKKFVSENDGVIVYKYAIDGYKYTEMHVGGKIITIESIHPVGVFVK